MNLDTAQNCDLSETENILSNLDFHQRLLARRIQAAHASDRLSLRLFLQVLFAHDSLEKTKEAGILGDSIRTHEKRVRELSEILVGLAEGKIPTIPRDLRKNFGLEFLQKEKAEFEEQVSMENKILSKRRMKPNLRVNWHDLASQLIRREPCEHEIQRLTKVLQEISQGKKPRLPALLKGRFELSNIRNAWERAAKTNQMPAEQTCKALAIDLAISSIPSREMEISPCARIIGKLIGLCATDGIDEAFIRDWVASEGEYEMSKPGAAELGRLDREGIQLALLQELNNLFPQKAREWFGKFLVDQAKTRMKKSRGRKPDTDPANDKRISDRWKRSGYRTIEEFAMKEGLNRREVRLAIDRHKKRSSRLRDN